MKTPRCEAAFHADEVAVTSSTNAVEFADGEFSIEASAIAEGFAIDPALVQARMREGKLTSRCERGVDQDAGHYRLTFFYDNRRFHLIVDETGALVERSATVSDPARAPSRGAFKKNAL